MSMLRLLSPLEGFFRWGGGGGVVKGLCKLYWNVPAFSQHCPLMCLFQVTVEKLIMMPHIVTMANQILTISTSADVCIDQNSAGQTSCAKWKSGYSSEQCGFGPSLLPPVLKKIDLNGVTELFLLLIQLVTLLRGLTICVVALDVAYHLFPVLPLCSWYSLVG